MSRVHITSKPRIFSYQRTHPWKHEDRPVLDVKICYHQIRYCVEIIIESLLGEKTVSRVLIISGINKYVNETAETIPIQSIGTSCAGKLAARSEAKPKQTPTDTSSHAKREIKDEVKQESCGEMSIPNHERQWIDIEPADFSQGCLEISKLVIRLLRHDEEHSQRTRRSSKI